MAYIYPVSGTVPAIGPLYPVAKDPNAPGDNAVLPVSWDVKGAAGDGFAGTATPDALVKVSAANGATTIAGIQAEELPDSPEIERGEQATVTKRFRMPYNSGRQLLSVLYRGVILQDSEISPTYGVPNLYRILSTRIQREKPEMCIFTIVSEGLTFDLPPDEFSLTPVELGINILKHPRYFFALDPNGPNGKAKVKVGDIEVTIGNILSSIIRAIQAYQDSPFFPNASNINGLIQLNIINQIVPDSHGYLQVQYYNPTFNRAAKEIADPPNWYSGLNADKPAGNWPYAIVNIPSNTPGIQLALAAAQEIVQKIWRVEDNPYLVGFQMQWSTYFNFCPAISPGGYIEDPIAAGVPDYFTNSQGIFDYVAALNPQCYSSDGTSDGLANISWLRKSDDLDYQRTWFKQTRTWIGSAYGAWDSDIFSGGPRPSVPTDYSPLPQY